VNPLREPLRKAIAAAATLNGKTLALLIASSLVATAGIVASALTGTGGLSPVEAAARALLGQPPAQVAATSAPAPVEPAPAPAPASPEPTPSAAAASSAPLPASAPSPAPEAAPAPEPEAPAPPAAEPELPEAGPIKHVFLISLASPGYDAAFGTESQMPYLATTLRPEGVLLSDYSLLDAAAMPNALAAISGQAPTAASKADCVDYEACLQPVETLSLADQMSAGRFTWHAYLEDMADAEGKPDNCVHPEPDAPETPALGGYSAKLNPFVFFHSLLDLGDCAANDVPLTELAKDLKKVDTTADFNYLAPNLCSSGFRGQCPEGAPEGAAAADAWLEQTVGGILASPAYKKDGLLIVSFGAADPAPPTDPAATPPADPLKTGALLVSPLLTPGGTDAAPYDPYSLLRSIEDLFGLAPLGAAEGKKVRSFASAFVAAETAAGD
jgi:hypothetical protein